MILTHRDTFVHKGSSHYICEDFVYEGQNSNFSYIILSDGCSSSNRSDIASNLVSLSAHKILSHWAMSDREGVPLEEFEESMLRNMKSMKEYFHLGNNFDATLLVAYEFNDVLNIKCFGDGIFGIKLKDKQWKFYSVDYSDNTPYYLSYRMNSSLDEQYKKTIRQKTIDMYDVNDKCSLTVVGESDFDKNIHLKFPAEDVESVILASDGLKSFTFNGTTKYLSDVLLDLVSFKNLEGSFLKRRLNRMIKDYSPMSNYDDVSVCIMRSKS